MPFVEIFLPSGHREKVEILANTIFMTILEDVCIKRGMDFNRCYLNHNKNKIDLSLKFGMSKLLNNVKIDLIETPSSLIDDASVEVVMQLPNSARVNSSFNPKESIYSIMETFVETQPHLRSIIFPDAIDMTTIVFYLHDQITGKYCLQNTTLSSLGLRMGRVLFRLEFKIISEEDKIKYDESMKMKVAKYLKGEENCRNKEEKKAIESMVDITYNPVSHEYTNFNKPTITANDELNFDNFVPFSAFSSQNKSMFDGNAREADQKVQQKRSQTLGELLGINLDQESSDVHSQSQEFLNFKFPERTNIDDDDEKKKKQCNEVGIPSEERESILYYHSPAQYNTTNDDVSDTFFDLTEQDIRSIIQGYRNVSESDSPLMTNTLREQMRESKFSKYQRCIIQFKFKDAYILQSVFKPRETVGDLYNYLSNFFKNNSCSFYLFTSPPKDVLKTKDKNLLQAGLVPMCKVYVSVKAVDLSNHIDSLLFGNEIEARKIIEKWMKMENNDATSSDTIELNRHVKSNSGNAHKMPKWFKSGP